MARVSRYRCLIPVCNQQLGEGMTVSNGMIFVAEGQEREVQKIPWVSESLLDGSIKYLGTDQGDQAAAEIVPESTDQPAEETAEEQPKKRQRKPRG